MNSSILLLVASLISGFRGIRLQMYQLSPVPQPLLLDQQPPPHVPAVEVTQLNIVIMDVDKTEDDSADNTETKDDNNDIDFLLDSVISETKENNMNCLFLIN
jgi:hypothetical protein